MRQFVYYWLECRENKYKPFLDTFIIILIIISVVTTLLQNTQIYYAHYKLLDTSESVITCFFLIEYLLRFYISSDFLSDINGVDGSIFKALKKKIRWFLNPLNIIDLLAIIPEARYFRLFRILRLLRVFRQSSSIMMVVRTYKQQTRVFLILFASVIGVVFINAFLSFIAANPMKNEVHFEEFLLYHLKILDFATDENPTVFSNLIASSTMLVNITFVAIFISLITNKMEDIMTKIKEGHLGKITIKDHIVLCGFSTCSGKVINELIQSKKSENIVLVTEKENPDISGIIYYHGDYSDINVLRQINVKDAKMCIVFSEFQEHDTIKSVDLRTVLTVFNVESENKNIHTIAEIINQENGVLIKDRVDGDEIIFKETIDANLICNCIRHPYLSPVVYDLLNVDDHVLEEGRLVDFGLSSPCEFKEIRIKMIEKDITLLGVIFADEREPKLSPKNSEIITANDRLLFIKS